jgi:hypothetical protein
MLEVLRASASIGDAIGALAEEFGQPEDVIRSDVVALCEQLAERGLIERHDGHDG